MVEKSQLDIKAIEKKWLEFWEEKKIYKFVNKGKKTYSIDTPPPYVSGRMHIGHACSYSQQDFIARFRRMKQGVFYPFGTDDNGLPTERYVEKIHKIKSKDMKRSEFIELCIKTLKKMTPEFVQDWKDLGISCDYDVYYSTIDKHSQKVSQKSFIDLFKQGDAYKKEFPTLWCIECQTTVAQAELEDKEQETLFSTLKFKSKGKDLLIATTRPELLGACVAVFVNPDDDRYKDLVGGKAKVPLFEHEVPIIADSSADMEKGTGVLMICSYGDKYDVEAVNRHKLGAKIIFAKDGKLNVRGYGGLEIKDARKKILEDLKKAGLIKEQKKIKHVVNVHDRCGMEIEFLPTEQWFIKILDKKKQLIEKGREVKWHPDFMRKRYENWVNGLEWDWSISRDRHFGIPIPVWYCESCDKVILPKESELPIDPLEVSKKCPECGKNAKAEEKVFDTWMTSSLSPQIASGLIDKGIDIPYSLRPQGHDIIRTWAFYTIVKAYLHSKKIPWGDIMVSGFVILDGEKMSKSKGNVVVPHEVVGKFGSDALRFWASGSKLGEDLDYQEKDLVTGKRFITKIVNASRFVFMNLKDYQGDKPKKLEKTDELFLRKLNSIVKSVTGHFENYEYSKARDETERFFWHMFCDNYLEIVKNRIYKGTPEQKISAQYVLYKSLLMVIKLMAPIMPFITEELYQNYFKKTEKEESIHISKWPEFELEQATEEFDLFIEILARIRQEKTRAQKSMKTEVVLTLPSEEEKKLNGMIDDLKAVINAKEIKKGDFGVEFV